jgi:hypothetical protein
MAAEMGDDSAAAVALLDAYMAVKLRSFAWRLGFGSLRYFASVS